MNMQSIMAQAQKMQRDINKKKDEIDKMEFVGESELVEIVVNGKKEVKKVTLKLQSNISLDDKEILEDMIMLAMKSALNKVDKEVEEKLGSYSQSLNGLL